jgi:hypothetical protein
MKECGPLATEGGLEKFEEERGDRGLSTPIRTQED